MSEYLKDSDFLRHIKRCFTKGVVRYDLIQDGDKIMVALSGGKDSLTMLELLANQSRIFKPRFSVIALHVVMKNVDYISDIDYLRSYSENLGVPFYYEETYFDSRVDSDKSPCFLCSWYRRKILFKKAKELNCNKIALGHHMDDILCTLLMNMTFLGKCESMLPRLVMNNFDVTIIRPLCLVHERDLIEYAKMRNFREQIKKCPYEDKTNRNAMKNILCSLEKINPEARFSLWHSLTDVQAKSDKAQL